MFCVTFAASVATGTPTWLRFDATKDNSIVLYPGEEHLNAGGKPRIRIKGNQHLVALDFDLDSLRGKVVEEAVLVCTPGEHRIDGVTIATIQADWDERKSSMLTSGAGSVPGWGRHGALFPEVTGGNGGSLVCRAQSEIRDGAYRWRVDPDIVHAIALGLAHGLSVHEWSADYSRNPTVFSREAERSRRPHLLVRTGGKDPAPEPPTGLTVEHDGDPDTLRLVLTAPRRGFAYEVEVDGRPLPRWNVPHVQPGERQVIAIRDVLLIPGKKVKFEVATLNRTGKRSKAVSVRAEVPKPGPAPSMGETPHITIGVSPSFIIIPVLDKLDADGSPVGDNRIVVCGLDGSAIPLRAARGEVIGFTALIDGEGEVGVKLDLPGIRTEVRRALYVKAGDRLVPDPLVPFETLSLTKERDEVVVADIYVPFDEKRRQIEGKLSLTDGREVPVKLAVRDFALPRRASFLCEMNTYGVPDTVKEYDRLQEIAYDHRVHVNVHHYSHRTAAPGARKCNLDMRMADGRRMDEKRYNAIQPGGRRGFWDDFVSVFGPHLTGHRFAKGHRGRVPLPGFYLTFHESWPLNVRAFFNGDPDAYEAFREKPEYAETFLAVLRDFIRTAKREGFTDAGFQVYLNNKGSLADARKAPWILDEPASYFDYRALAYYADLVAKAKGDACPVPVRFRIDISRPQFDRGELRGKGDLWVVSTGAFRRYPRLVRDRAPDFWLYGSSNKVEESNRAIHAWVLEAYRGGATGVVPWQTVDRSGKALREADTLGLFIFDGWKDGEPVIHHSLRLKAYRRAQQDVEYLEVLRRERGLTRGQIREIIDRHLSLPGERGPDAFRGLREEVAALIEGRDQK